MKILLPLATLAFLLVSCGAVPSAIPPSTVLSGEVPTAAKVMSGYEYPAMPLSEYQALQSGSAKTWSTDSSSTSSAQ